MEQQELSPPDEAEKSAPHPSAETIRRGYEHTHLNLRALLIVLACFVVTAALIHLGAWFLEEGLLSQDRQLDRPLSAISADPHLNGAPPLQPGGPSHDTVPQQDLKAMYAAEDQLFERAGWVDPSSRAVVVPIAIANAIASRAPASQPAGGGGK